MSNMPKIGAWKRGISHPTHDHARDVTFEDVRAFFKPKKSLLERVLPSTGLAKADLRKFCSPVEDQSTVGSCVANAVVGGLELLQRRDGVKTTDLSRLFVYYNARLADGDPNDDGGTYVATAMASLNAQGTCSETKWKYNVDEVLQRPCWAAYREAYANKISGYYKITSTGSKLVDDIKAALDSQHPVVFGMLVDDEFMTGGKKGVLSMPKTKGRNIQGGHSTLIVGYDDSTGLFTIRNSWGTSWGDKGYYYVPFAYLEASEADDFWVPTHGQVLVKQ